MVFNIMSQWIRTNNSKRYFKPEPLFKFRVIKNGHPRTDGPLLVLLHWVSFGWTAGRVNSAELFRHVKMIVQPDVLGTWKKSNCYCHWNPLCLS